MAQIENAGRLRRAAVVSQIILALLATMAAITYLGPVLQPFLIALLCFFAVKPLVDAATRRGIPAWLSYLVLFIAILAACVIIVQLVSLNSQAFMTAWPKYQERFNLLVDRLPGNIRDMIKQVFTLSTEELFGFLVLHGISVLELVTFGFFYFVFIVLSARSLPARIRWAFPSEQGEKILLIGGRIGEGIERFMRVKTIVGVGMALTTALILFWFQIDYWPLWAFSFFILNYITYIGSIVACGPPIAVALLTLPNPWNAVILGVLVIVNRTVWIDYAEIRLLGKHLHLDSVLIFLWLAYWAWTWGVVGLLLAFPMLACLKIAMENIEATRSFSVLIGDD